MTRNQALRMASVLCGALILPLAIIPATSTAAEIQRCTQVRPYRDLNGDGYEDAVVGDPYATVNGQAEAGTSLCSSATRPAGSARAVPAAP